MPVTKIRGIQLAYDDLGKENRNVIVFVHGHPFNRSMWKYQVAHFSTDYRLVLPDLRGYGETEAATPKTLLDEMALDLSHLLDELNIDQALFCGLSMGGQIVLDFYRLFPHKVKAMIIADSDARAESPESYSRRLQLAETILRDGMKQHTDDTLHQYIAETSRTQTAMVAHLYDMMSTNRAEGAAAAHRGRAERRDHLPILPSIRIPTLIIVGEEDYFTPLPIAALMHDAIPNAELVCIPASGHLPNMEAPEPFNHTLHSFLKRNSL
ncbi:MAG TPA: alpha/beta hydrolase [Puia sp.]